MLRSCASTNKIQIYLRIILHKFVNYNILYYNLRFIIIVINVNNNLMYIITKNTFFI